MTQEELDALMAGDLDDIADSEPIVKQEPIQEKEEKVTPVVETTIIDPNTYRVNPETAWPPPPPTEDHKMVHQLDDVTRDSEKKATELFDKLETINGFFMDAESGCKDIKKGIDKNLEIFTLLSEKFPNVPTFSEAIEQNNSLKSKISDVVDNLQMGQDEIMMAMDMMQYQDIHRQKIERVINVMRALSKYMNTLFEGKIDDDKRVGSAVHIAGDTTTENLVSNDDIEALIESLGKK
ncbi:chemotaxis protein [Campylobacter mucosalis]|uniref:chemotaxis protein n=1 Tax=Campylobacter mucosalis TaxID=202 RepID=UPI0014708540|nr:chemotaxis protein [Campylobacter mucosalis]